MNRQVYTAESFPNGLDESVDRKFKILAINPHKGVIYDDHHAVLFLAKDKVFLETLPTYIENLVKSGADSMQIIGAKLMMERVRQYQERNPDIVKVPDIDQAKEVAVIQPNIMG